MTEIAKPSDNRHPADELAELRQQLRWMEAQEKSLRAQLLDMNPSERKGARYSAKVTLQARKKLNIEKLEEEIGDLSGFYETIKFVLVKIEKLK